MIPVLKVVRPGSCTTIQDKGRQGFRQFGMPPSGAVDRFSYGVANLLAGADEGSAALELTFFGGEYQILAETNIALAGADMEASLNGKKVDGWRSFEANPGDTLRFGQAKTGCRTYLAVAGGIDAPLVMGSRSCFAGAKIGGLYGRALKQGDIVYTVEEKTGTEFKRLPDKYRPRYGSEVLLRAVAGPQEEFFEKSIDAFFGEVYTVGHESSRLGLRLEGPPVQIAEGKPKSIISEPSLPGSVQIPENGQPIVLLSEQTVGGYAKIATVVSGDLDRIAQLTPGDKVRFERVDLAEAHRIFHRHCEKLERISQSLEFVRPLFSGEPRMSAEELWKNDPEAFAQRIGRWLLQA